MSSVHWCILIIIHVFIIVCALRMLLRVVNIMSVFSLLLLLVVVFVLCDVLRFLCMRMLVYS